MANARMASPWWFSPRWLAFGETISQGMASRSCGEDVRRKVELGRGNFRRWAFGWSAECGQVASLPD